MNYIKENLSEFILPICNCHSIKLNNNLSYIDDKLGICSGNNNYIISVLLKDTLNIDHFREEFDIVISKTSDKFDDTISVIIGSSEISINHILIDINDIIIRKSITFYSIDNRIVNVSPSKDAPGLLLIDINNL